MRLVPTILALSIAANLGLAVVWTFTNPARTASILPEARSATHSVKIGADANDNPAVFVPARFAGAFNAGNAAVLFAQLKALGVSDTRAGDITNRFIWLKYDTRRRELLGLKNTDPSALTEREAAAQLTAAERRELRDLANQASRESLAILGAATVDGIELISKRYSFLPPEKVAQLQYLQRDYAEMRDAITGESARFPLPSDAKQLKILDEEFRKDITGLFTPEELDYYDMHFSETATKLRHVFTGIDLTDAEFRAIYEGSAFTITERDSSDNGRTMHMRSERMTYPSRQTMSAILGEERLADFYRAKDLDYQGLLAAADRFHLPSGNINNVYDLRLTAASESQRIEADSTLTLAEKKQAIQDLANSIKGQVREQLGDEVGDVYLQKYMYWLRGGLSDGHVVRAWWNGAVDWHPVGGWPDDPETSKGSKNNKTSPKR